MVDILVKFKGRKSRIVAHNIPFSQAVQTGMDAVKYSRKAVSYSILPLDH